MSFRNDSLSIYIWRSLTLLSSIFVIDKIWFRSISLLHSGDLNLKKNCYSIYTMYCEKKNRSFSRFEKSPVINAFLHYQSTVIILVLLAENNIFDIFTVIILSIIWLSSTSLFLSNPLLSSPLLTSPHLSFRLLSIIGLQQRTPHQSWPGNRPL